MKQNTLPILWVEYTPLTSQQIQTLSVMEIKTHYTRGGSKEGTPYDSRLGVLEQGESCQTCGKRYTECSGHYGYIHLATPLFNPQYLSQVLMILKCVCHKCSSPLLSENSPQFASISNYKNFNRLKMFKKKCENVTNCPKCHSLVIKIEENCNRLYTKVKHRNDSKTQKGVPITPESVCQIFIGISSHTMKLLGFNTNLTQNPNIVQHFQNQHFQDRESIHHAAVSSSSYLCSGNQHPQHPQPIPRNLQHRESDNTPQNLQHLQHLQHLQTTPRNPQSTQHHIPRYRKDMVFDPSLSLSLSHPHEIKPTAFLFEYAFPVIPPQARPWVSRGDDKCDDDLTELINTTVKINNKIRMFEKTEAEKILHKKNSKKKTRESLIEALYDHILLIFDNSKNTKGGGERKHKGLKERMSGKDGHIQTNAAGKRVDFSARSVIVGAGPLCDSGTFGVPKFMSEKLTVPEAVVQWNIGYLSDLLRHGEILTVLREGHKINVKMRTNNYTRPFEWNGTPGLQEGDVVERKLRNGDPVLINRQPTLRIESMQGVKVKIMEGENAFRLHLSQTRPLNADFDGDCCLI